MTQKTIFISDLHLEAEQPEIFNKFLKLLNNSDEGIDAFYILGDFFETWIGDDAAKTFFHLEIIQALFNTTQRGIPIYLMHGNRDFLIGKNFLKDTGCRLLTDPTRKLIYDMPVLLMHGDTLCINDLKYQIARKKLRNPFLQKFFLLLPLFIRKKIANKIRRKSQNYTASHSLNIMDVDQAEVERMMTAHQVNMLIHGHTHKPAIYEFQMHRKSTVRIVLGAWHEKANMLIWHADQHKEWVEF